MNGPLLGCDTSSCPSPYPKAAYAEIYLGYDENFSSYTRISISGDILNDFISRKNELLYRLLSPVGRIQLLVNVEVMNDI